MWPEVLASGILKGRMFFDPKDKFSPEGIFFTKWLEYLSKV